jgi:Putative protein-S-isoprenylcysteine methyltransferase
MIQTIGMIELLIFYAAYLMKLFSQKRRGIKTNQLGIGDKVSKTIMIEKLLGILSTITILVMLISAILNTSLFNNQLIRGLGLVLFGFGTTLFIIAMITMKDSWRAGIPSSGSTSIVTVGIYKISRNPAFLGFDLTYIGVSFAFGNIVLLVMSIIMIIMMHLQILEEEKFLDSTFGNEYLDYKNKVGRYFIFF